MTKAQKTTTNIRVKYTAVDRFSKSATFRTLAGARRFAQKWVGEYPDFGSWYAVSSSGTGKVEVTGCSLADLFPGVVVVEPVSADESAPGWAQRGDELTGLEEHLHDEAYECGEVTAMRAEAEREAALEAQHYEHELAAEEREDQRRFPGGRCVADSEYLSGGPWCETKEEAEVVF